MIKFIHKRHMHDHEKNIKVVVYYSVSDIFLGLVLLTLVAFFINDYFSYSRNKSNDSSFVKNSINLPFDR